MKFISMIVLLCFSSLAFGGQDPCYTIEFQNSPRPPLELCDDHFSKKAQEAWQILSAENYLAFQNKRQKVIGFVANQIASHSNRLPTQNQMLKLLQSLDSRLVENLAAVQSCQQFGVCTGFGGDAAIGISKFVYGRGIYGSREFIYDFKTETWTKNRVRDVSKATSGWYGTVTAQLSFRVMIYFGNDLTVANEVVDVTYLPLTPIIVMHGLNSWGFGVTVGPPAQPMPVAAFTTTTYKMLRQRKALACEQALNDKRPSLPSE